MFTILSSQDTADYVPQLEAMLPVLCADAEAAVDGKSAGGGGKPAAGSSDELAAAALRALNAYDGMASRLGGRDGAFPAVAAALVAAYAHSQPSRWPTGCSSSANPRVTLVHL